MQHQHQFQQQPDLFHQQQQGNASFMYGSPYGHQAYPFQQQQQQHPHHQHQASSSWGTPYDNGFDAAGGAYGVPTPAPPQQPPMPPEPAAGPPSTELALPRDSPRAVEPAAYPSGFPHHQAAPVAAAAATAASYGIVSHTNAGGGGGGFTHHRAPVYDDLPPAARAPPSTYPPSSESGDSSEAESEENDRDVAVTRYEPPRAAAAAPTASPPHRRRLIRRAPKKSPYPTETRYVPPTPERLNGGYYPKETRGQQHEGERPGVSRGGSGLVLKLHLGSEGPDRGGTAAPPTSVGPPVSRSRRGSQGGVGGLIQQMDRMFSDVMGGGVLGAGFSLDVAGEEGSGRGLSRSFSAGGRGSSSSSSMGSGGFGRASMMSSRTVVDAGSRTLFSRTERTVINADGTRETDVSFHSGV